MNDLKHYLIVKLDDDTTVTFGERTDLKTIMEVLAEEGSSVQSLGVFRYTQFEGQPQDLHIAMEHVEDFKYGRRIHKPVLGRGLNAFFDGSRR